MSTPTIWHIPYQRNPFFTGREDILTQLHRTLQADARVALSHPLGISGLGGIGKTQAALEYAYRYRSDYEAIFWVRADSVTSLISSLVELAHTLQLPERSEQDQEIIVQAVLRWFRLHSNWLLIYDNIDDLSIAEPFLPKAGSGHLLFTTRAHAIGEIAQRLDIAKMEPEIGALLLLRRANLLALQATLNLASPEDQSVARIISQELDGLPLALDQAGAYIKEAPCSLADYLARYRTRHSNILRERGSSNQDYPASVATTWSLSFEKVRQANPATADLIDLCAFLAPDAIPEEMIMAGASYLSPSLQSAIAHPLLFDRAVAASLHYSLLIRNVDPNGLSMHRLVQTVLRDTLPIDTKKLWMHRAVYIMHEVCSYKDKPIQWGKMERYLPHALVCINWIKQENMTFPQAANLPFYTGHGLKERAKYAEAEPLFQHALSIWQQVSKTDNSFVAPCLDGLGQVYKKQGKYKQAEEFYMQALSICEPLFGNSHPFTATLFNDIAALYESMGKEKQAEQFYQRSLTIRQLLLGDDHFDTAQSRKNLADLYVGQGRYAEAEPLLQYALAATEQSVGLDEPTTNLIVGSLAQLYKKQGRYDEAEALYRRALEHNMPQLGMKHPQVVKDLNNLAVLYYDQEKYEAAETLYQRVLALDEEVWGSEHLEMAIDLNNLAALYCNQEKYEQAEQLYKRALAINTQWLGASHPQTITSLCNLAALYIRQGKEKLGEALYHDALVLSEQQEDYLNITIILNHLAYLYNKQEKYAEAEPLCFRAWEIATQQLGVDHPNKGLIFNNLAEIYKKMGEEKNEERLHSVQPDTIIRLNNLAEIYRAQGKDVEAEPLLKQALAISQRQLGARHPNTAAFLNNLAALYKTQGKYIEAILLYKQALAIYRHQLGAWHLNTATCLNNLGELYRIQRKYTKAESLLKRALAIYERQSGDMYPEMANCLNNLALLYTNQGKYDQAKPIYQRALTIREQLLGADHPDVAASLSCLAELYCAQRKYAEAKPLLKRALEICKRALRSEHPTTRMLQADYAALLEAIKNDDARPS